MVRAIGEGYNKSWFFEIIQEKSTALYFNHKVRKEKQSIYWG